MMHSFDILRLNRQESHACFAEMDRIGTKGVDDRWMDTLDRVAVLRMGGKADDEIKTDVMYGLEERLDVKGSVGRYFATLLARCMVDQALEVVAAEKELNDPIKVSSDELGRRKAICGACSELVNDRCRIYGDFYAAKILLAAGHCPIGEWKRVEGEAK